MRKQLGLRIDQHLKDNLDEQAKKSGLSATTLLENYITLGLARDHGDTIEQNSLPLIRELVRHEISLALAPLSQQITNLQQSSKHGQDRLTGLIVKTARYGGLAYRLIYSLTAKTVSLEFAKHVFDDAQAKTGRDLLQPNEPPPI